MFNRSRDQARQWELENMTDYDTCKTGSSAKLAALNRNIIAECAVWLDMHVASIFHDYQQFSDSIDIEKLIIEATFYDIRLLWWSKIPR